MKKVFGVILIIIAIFLFICSAFGLLQLTGILASITPGAYEAGYITGYLLVMLGEILSGIFLLRKGRKLIKKEDVV